MENILPKVLPVNELKNTAAILKTCKESRVPIIITRNGYGEAVMMSVNLFEEILGKAQIASLLNESLDEIENGAEPVDGFEFLEQMKEKYGK